MSSFFLQHHQALGVFRVADAGDGVLRAQLLGRQTADHVQLVAAGDGDDYVRRVDASLDERAHVRAVAADAHHVQRFAGTLQRGVALVDNGDVVTVFAQKLSQRVADLAASDNDNVQ